MLHAVEQQGVRTAQQAEEQDALCAQKLHFSLRRSKEALLEAEIDVCRESVAAAAAALHQQIEQQHQKLKEQRRVSEELEPQHRNLRSRLGLAQLEFVEGNEAHSAAHAALKTVAGELQRARDELLHSKTALEKSKVDYKRGSAQRDLAATLLPPFVARKGELELQKKAFLKEAAMRAKEAEVLKAENEALYGSIKGDNKRREDLEADAAQLLLRLSRWSAMEAEVTAQRQSAALAVAESERLRRETQEQLKLKTLEVDSAQKRLRELTEAQQREQLGIERVRQQCESYANQMQVTTQGLAELLERQKVLASELDVFSQDIKNKEATTQAIALQCLKALQQRAVLRNQHSRLLQKIAKCNEEVEQSMLTSERLNCCLSEMEETMKRQKDAYERANRVILSLLLLQRAASAAAAAELRELSRLKSMAGELKHQLQQQQKRPEPPMEDLQAKEKELQKQLRLKQSQLIDLELQLEELDAHAAVAAAVAAAAAAELQKQVSPDRELAFELLQRLGSLRQRLEDIRRKRRCLSSEATMYKAMLPQLECMQQRLLEELETARVNVLQRLPPSEAAAAELQQQEERRRKKRQILKEMKEKQRSFKAYSLFTSREFDRNLPASGIRRPQTLSAGATFA
ncbi:hypothetical protein Emag_001097 [Eimeria magna]